MTAALGAATDPAVEFTRLKTWLCDLSLPLWAGEGYDAKNRRFEELLPLPSRDRGPTTYRVMVQARQIATFARAGLTGLHPGGGEIAQDAFDAMVRTYHRADGGEGWVFSATPQGRVCDPRRDLYAHAFVVFACAWMFGLTGSQRYRRIADQTLSVIDSVFASGGPGYASMAGRSGDPRQQNPHMHLLEALLVLFSFSRDQNHLDRASALVALLRERLISREYGVVLEEFDARWRPICASGGNVAEPGHQLEWAWLLTEYARLRSEDVAPEKAAMLAFVFAHGADHGQGKIFDLVREDGAVVSTASRVWPQTEALRILGRERACGRFADDDFISRLTRRLLSSHCPGALRGGWYDRLDANERPVVSSMPASTLYHVAGAVLDSMESLVAGPFG